MAKNVYRHGKKAVSISASGTLNLKLGQVRLTGSRLEVKMESGRGIFPLRGAHLSRPFPNDYMPGGGVRVLARTMHNGVEITTNVMLPEEGPFLGISVQVRNPQNAVIALQRVTLLRLPLRKIAPIGSAPKPYMYIDSDHSTGDAGLHALSGEPAEDELLQDASQNVAALFVPGGDCFFAGCLLSGHARNTLSIDQDRLSVTADFHGEIPPHSCVETDVLVLSGGLPLHEVLTRFAALRAGRRRAMEAAGFRAWTSSHWYAKGLAESDIMDNLEFMKETPWLRDSLQYVIAGQGWERARGDWEPQERFPSLMDTLASRIRDAGFLPGIWAAPLQAARTSALAASHPDWVLRRTDRKEPEVGQLDFSLPEVRDYVYTVMRRMYHWGYRYFQTDFDGCVLDPAQCRFRGASESILESFKSLATAIRAALGEDSFWVAANVPLSVMVGRCDAISVTRAVRPYFSTLLGCARAGMFRSHQHGRLWLNDPGLLVVRGPQTAHAEALLPGDNAGGPYTRYGLDCGPMLSRGEARLWATWLIMSGGIVTLGDRLPLLTAEGLSIVRKTLMRAGNQPAQPLDMGVVPLPRIWQRVESGMVSLALFNWSDTENEVVVSASNGAVFPPNGELFEVWTEDTVRIKGETLRRRLAPHACELYEWDL